jgi:hypothetical protein
VFVFFETIPNQLIHLFPDRPVLNALDDFSSEGMDQHAPGHLFAHATRAQVENRFVIQLPDRRQESPWSGS